MTGLNSNRHWYLSLSGMELYGTMHGQPFAAAAPKAAAGSQTLLGVELVQTESAAMDKAIKALDSVHGTISLSFRSISCSDIF